MNLDLFFSLVDGCRERGVFRVRLADGTEIHLDPSHGQEPEPNFAPRVTESLPNLEHRASVRQDDIAAELDRELFGKPLE